jgi:hypothetical protein
MNQAVQPVASRAAEPEGAASFRLSLNLKTTGID